MVIKKTLNLIQKKETKKKENNVGVKKEMYYRRLEIQKVVGLWRPGVGLGGVRQRNLE